MISFWLRRITCVIYRLDITFIKIHVAQFLLPEGDICSANICNLNFLPCQEVEKWQWLVFIWHLIEKFLKICSLYIRKTSNLKLRREDVAGFKDKFYHFQYATLEMFNEAFNNSSMLKLRFFPSTSTLLQCLVKTSPISIMQLFRTGNHIFCRRIAQNRGRSLSIFFYLPQVLLLCSLFSFER